uniref:F-box/kelch-repeat protein At3g06240-like n=1 Tax=Erigeron canadensis TaxID=72917 RepID=UPI001CB92D6C|nr:F-box/kelch-repeat protein At3g06240-like [Erigeron canadensis]
MAALPEDIITQILYSVPAKSIGRFRCVSKGWLSLLTHPDFIKTHQKTLNKLHLIFLGIEVAALYSNSFLYHHEPNLRNSDMPLIEFSFVNSFVPTVKIGGSCNGLVLVGANKLHLIDTLVLLNPTTKESMILPEIFDFSYLDAYTLFDVDHLYGLGYDDSVTGGDFKVVSLTCLQDTFPLRNGGISVDVYSLKTNTWRRLTDSLDDYLDIHPKRECAFVNGSLHWVATKSTVNGLKPTVILALSLADEKFSEVPTPEFVESTKVLSRSYCQLVVLGGKLAFFLETKGEIWLMNEYRIKESWTKISLHGIRGIPNVRLPCYNKPMVFCHDGKFMVANSDRMMVYDDEKGAFEETVCVWDPVNFRVIGSYVESLVSIASCIEQ